MCIRDRAYNLQAAICDEYIAVIDVKPYASDMECFVPVSYTHLDVYKRQYYDAKIFENDPFAKLDQTGVGKLMEMAIELGKPVNPSLHVGICGEHGGDPSSVEFCNKIGLDYVSCSPRCV